MTHTPPVPPGNQSPYPRQAPPAPIEPPPLMRGEGNSKRAHGVGLLLGFGVAAVALIAGVLMFRNAGADDESGAAGQRMKATN